MVRIQGLSLRSVKFHVWCPCVGVARAFCCHYRLELGHFSLNYTSLKTPIFSVSVKADESPVKISTRRIFSIYDVLGRKKGIDIYYTVDKFPILFHL